MPLLCLEGVHGLPGAPQGEAGLTRKFETSHVGGATCRTTPISRSALDKNPMPGHLFEGNPVDEGTTRRGTDTPVHRPEKPAGSTHSSTRGLRPPEQLERQEEFHSSDKTRPDSPVPTLHGPCDRSQKWRGSLRFLPPLEMRPSSVAPNPVESREAPPSSQYPCPLRGTLGSSLKSLAEVEGNDGFLLQHEKDLESPSSTCLEALVPSQDSRAMTRSPSPRPRRPDFPGAAREAP